MVVVAVATECTLSVCKSPAGVDIWGHGQIGPCLLTLLRRSFLVMDENCT
jgi:hypothetical protein